MAVRKSIQLAGDQELTHWDQEYLQALFGQLVLDSVVLGEGVPDWERWKHEMWVKLNLSRQALDQEAEQRTPAGVSS